MGDWISNMITGVITNVPIGDVPVLANVTFMLSLFHQANATEKGQSAVQSQTLLQSSSSWDGEPYKSYPSGQPKVSILKITLLPHTKLEWHSHHRATGCVGDIALSGTSLSKTCYRDRARYHRRRARKDVPLTSMPRSHGRSTSKRSAPDPRASESPHT